MELRQQGQNHSNRTIFDRRDIDLPINRRFECCVRQDPGKPAIIKGRETLSYGELNLRANQLAHEISAKHQADSPIGILSAQAVEPLVAVIAVLKAGRTFVLLDLAHPPSRLREIITDAGIELVLCSSDQAGTARRLARPAECQLLEIDSARRSASTGDLALEPVPDSQACIVYTSGTTGTPKGVCHSHRNIMHSIMRSTNSCSITADDRWLLLVNSAHMGGINGMLRVVLNGATVFPYSFFENSLNTLAAYVQTQGITIFHAVPAVFRLFAKALPHGTGFPHLRLLLIGGEALFKNDVQLFRERFNPPCKLINHLGCTEFSGYAEYMIDHDTVIDGGIVPVGFPAEETELAIVDDNGLPVEAGRVGNVEIRSEFLAEGYWRDPELTRNRFGRCTAEGPRSYRPGDIGKIRADGCLIFMGRSDAQVQIRGNRVELIEIELALRGLAGIDEARVVAFSKAEDVIALAAYITLTAGAAVETGQIRTRLAAILPGYMIPEEIIKVSELPLNANGKVDIQALPKPASHSRASHGALLRPGQHQTLRTESAEPLLPTPPETMLEERLTVLWNHILNRQTICVTSNFFELGGDSLQAVDLHAQIEHEFGVSLPLSSLYEHGTIRLQADRIARTEVASSWSTVVRIKPGSDQNPLFLIHGIKGNILFAHSFARDLQTSRAVYALQPGTLAGQRSAFRNLAMMAADYVAEIRRIQPVGPYWLGGYSFGGTVAFEMARQLLKDGELVAGLLVFDSTAPGTTPAAAPVLRKVRGLLRLLPLNFRLRLGTSLSLEERIRYTRRVNRYLGDNYVAGSTAMRVFLFRSEERLAEGAGGWARLCRESPVMIVVPGEHDTLFKPPAVEQLTAGVDQILSEG